ncbi:AAA family ATPase [Cyclobacterium jeungdonense]|uniref:AAA family ATPase n=1 Tax=Cyclobacterium jeungdonense TaxID=708087 RepID=A0ABT8C7D8_9BACT|nr:AAA family ATPase [Cyclobacterium jeungdonense]MDN3688684.1 AAA family ATPase [Cyclobacterium jeungdonense]
MKTIIIVAGNMGSGKSTFCKRLIEKLPDYTYICLDDFRKKRFEDVLTEQHDPLQFEREVAAATQREFDKHDKILYETTGATRFFKDMHYRLLADRHNVFLVQIRCDPVVCLQRHRAREQNGHFHVVPQYGQGLTPEELINRYAEKTRWIRPDLTLDSETFSPDQLLSRFIRTYFPQDKVQDIQSLLDDFHYQEALDWFKRNVSGKAFVKETLSTGEDDFNRLKLKKELNEYLADLKNTPEDPAPVKPTLPGESQAKERPYQVEQGSTAASSPTYSEPTREEWAPLYKEANFLFIELEHETDEDKRKEMAFQILDLMDQVQELWDKADFVKKYGQLPDFDKSGIENLSEAQMTKRINTLRTYISKAKKGKLKAEKIPEWEAEKKELENALQ